MGGYRAFRDRMQQWFIHHAQGPYALVWMGLLAFLDGFISPLPTEVFLIFLILAHPARWYKYLLATIAGAILGAMMGYVVGDALFQLIGIPIINAFHLHPAFETAQHFLRGHVFLTMALMPFIIPIPEKIFVYAAGFLGVHFIPFILGFFLGHSIRLAIIAYLASKYGRKVFDTLKEYTLVIGIGILAVFVIYAIVHWHLLPL